MLLAFFSITFISGAIPAGLLANRIGRRKAILIGLTGVTLLFPALKFVENIVLVCTILFISGAFWALVSINSLPMVLQLCTHRDIGRYTGYYYVFSFSAAIVAPIFAGFLRDLLDDYSSVFMYAGVSFFIAILCMFFVKHGDVSEKKLSAADILEQIEI